jgi:LPS O-antigen subunit length determinant protein (WzzB/FepE family)
MSFEEKMSQDEFGLRDVWEIVLGRKWLVIATTAICVGLALAYVTLATTIYESRAMVQIGKVAGQPLDNPLQLASRLMNHYTLVNTELAKKQLPKLYAVTPGKEDGGVILTLEARARSSQEAQQFLQGIIQRLLASQQRRYDQLLKTRQAQLRQLQAQYEDLRPAINAKGRIGKAQADSASALLLLEQSRRTETLSTMLVAIAHKENELAPVNTMPTVETLSPRYDPNPVAPKRMLILVLAMVGGLMLGVFLALVQNGSRRQPERASS